MTIENEQERRWYDRDPVLSKAVKILEESDDKLQIQIALNLIKIIAEHNITSSTYTTVDEIIATVESGDCESGNARWYDVDKTIRAAIQLLRNCSQEVQHDIASDIASVVTEALNQLDGSEHGKEE